MHRHALANLEMFAPPHPPPPHFFSDTYTFIVHTSMVPNNSPGKPPINITSFFVKGLTHTHTHSYSAREQINIHQSLNNDVKPPLSLTHTDST